MLEGLKAAIIFSLLNGGGGGSGDAQPKMILESSAPTTATVGKLCQKYRDTSTGIEYTCTAVNETTGEYTWEKSFKARVENNTLYI